MNYNTSCIYKLCCNDSNITDIYIGSTTNFRRRKFTHKCACNYNPGKSYNCNVYKFIRNNGGWDNWNMVQIESYEAKDKRDLHSRERYWIETLKSTLNKSIPTRTKQEWTQDNKEAIIIQKKKWGQENKVEIGNKRKRYREKNKELLSNINKLYREKNKEEINDKRKTHLICECGLTTTNNHKARHMKSNLHFSIMLHNFIYS